MFVFASSVIVSVAVVFITTDETGVNGDVFPTKSTTREVK